MRRYRIYSGKYVLSEKLMENPDYTPGSPDSTRKWPDELIAIPKVFHVEITEDKKRVAFLTRPTYNEARAIGEDYCS